jgi:hypothetical protein
MPPGPLLLRSAQQRLAVVRREAPPAVRRVEEHAARRAEDEVAGEPDAPERHAQPGGHLELDDREGDGQADPPLDDTVEAAVVGVVVLGRRRGPVARLAVEHVVEPVPADLGRVGLVGVCPDPLGEGVQRGDRGRGVEVRTAVGGDDQGAFAEVDLEFGPRDKTGEPGTVRRAGSLGFGGRHRLDGTPGRRAAPRPRCRR